MTFMNFGFFAGFLVYLLYRHSMISKYIFDTTGDRYIALHSIVFL